MQMLFHDQKYAAKLFYDVGKPIERVTMDENLIHLKDELVRQKVTSDSIKKFSALVKERHVSAFGKPLMIMHIIMTDQIYIPDLEVNPAFLLTVDQGRSKGLTWLVDSLLNSINACKFSGTTMAGSNVDIAGATCDAFAHFSVHDSAGHLVFIDIQGIYDPIIFFPCCNVVKPRHY